METIEFSKTSGSNSLIGILTPPRTQSMSSMQVIWQQVFRWNTYQAGQIVAVVVGAAQATVLAVAVAHHPEGTAADDRV